MSCRLDEEVERELLRFGGQAAHDVPCERVGALALGGGVATWLWGIEDPAPLLRWGQRRGVPVHTVDADAVVVARTGGFRGVVIGAGPPPEPRSVRRALVLRATRRGVTAVDLIDRSDLGGLRLRSVRLDPAEPSHIEVLGDGDPRDAVELVEGVRARVEHDSGLSLQVLLRPLGLDPPRSLRGEGARGPRRTALAPRRST